MKTSTIHASVLVTVMMVARIASAADERAPQTVTSPSGACTLKIPAGWKLYHGKEQLPKTVVATFVPASWTPSEAGERPRSLIQVHEIAGPVLSSEFLRQAGGMSPAAETAALVLQRSCAERGRRSVVTKQEEYRINGMLGCHVGIDGPTRGGVWTAEMILLIAEKQDSLFGVMFFCPRENLQSSQMALRYVVSSLKPLRPVPKRQFGPAAKKLEHLKELLKRGNATEPAPWAMAVLGVETWRADAKDPKDTLLVHLHFLHPQNTAVCEDYVKVLGLIKQGIDFDATEPRSKFTRLLSAHAGALAMEVVRIDLEVPMALLVVYGKNEARLQAYEINLDTYRRVLQGRMDPKQLLLSSRALAPEELLRVPLPPIEPVLRSRPDK